MLKQIRQALYGFVKRRGEPLQVSGLSDEMLEGVRLIQQVGFASDLPIDTQVVMLPIGGRATNMVIIASGDAPVVVKAGEGEAVIYDQFGHELRLGADGIKAKGNLFIDGNVTSTGQISDIQGSMAEIRAVYNAHNHTAEGTSPPTNQMS